jgi:putative ABC transport system ATP-binding protein
MNAVVEAKGLGKTYRKGRRVVHALIDVTFAVEAGEFVALVGPSGSGKSTLLNLVAGFDRPTSGSIQVGGVDLARLSEKQLARWRVENIGFVFQAFNLISALTASENVEVPLRNLGVDSAQRRANVATALGVVGLANRAHHYPHELSGGEEQRVAIARAIVANSPILIADEPTGNLDAVAALNVLEIFRILREQHGKTILLVTHDPVAAACASRTVEMKKAVSDEGERAELAPRI